MREAASVIVRYKTDFEEAYDKIKKCLECIASIATLSAATERAANGIVADLAPLHPFEESVAELADETIRIAGDARQKYMDMGICALDNKNSFELCKTQVQSLSDALDKLAETLRSWAPFLGPKADFDALVACKLYDDANPEGGSDYVRSIRLVQGRAQRSDDPGLRLAVEDLLRTLEKPYLGPVERQRELSDKLSAVSLACSPYSRG